MLTRITLVLLLAAAGSSTVSARVFDHGKCRAYIPLNAHMELYPQLAIGS
jgi:hypothetical protein